MTKYELIFNHDLKLDIAQNMMKFGGSFVQALGEALLHADSNNTIKIETAFPEYIEEYHPDKWKKHEQEV